MASTAAVMIFKYFIWHQELFSCSQKSCNSTAVDVKKMYRVFQEFGLKNGKYWVTFFGQCWSLLKQAKCDLFPKPRQHAKGKLIQIYDTSGRHVVTQTLLNHKPRTCEYVQCSCWMWSSQSLVRLQSLKKVLIGQPTHIFETVPKCKTIL